MDNITHGSIGLIVGWLRRTDPTREDPDTDRAVPWATFMAAQAPDLDVFIRKLPGLEWVGHRAITHTLIALPFTALAVALICKLFLRRARFPVVFGWAALGMFVGHLVADVITWTGIRPFLPWSHHRVSYEIMPFIDLSFTLPMLLVVALSVMRPDWRRTLSMAFSVLALVYFTGRGAAFATAKAISPSAAAVPTGHRLVRLDAQGGYVVQDIPFWAPWQVNERRVPRASDDPAVTHAAWSLMPRSRYLRPRVPYLQIEPRGDLRRVIVVDLLPHFPLGYPYADLDTQGKVVRQGRTWLVRTEQRPVSQVSRK